MEQNEQHKKKIFRHSFIAESEAVGDRVLIVVINDIKG